LLLSPIAALLSKVNNESAEKVAGNPAFAHYQGKEFASLLLNPVLARLDAARLPCCLETQNLKNVALYRHFGFKVVHETLFDKTIPIYAMLRE
jgi:predicted GNAT family N-acyltransferase